MPKFKSCANNKFWENYNDLPDNIRLLADKAYELFKTNPQHAGLNIKKVGKKQPVYSVRITDYYRSLGYLEGDTVYWFWIGDHSSEEKMIKSI